MKKTFHWFLVLGMVAGLLAALMPTAGPVHAATLGWTNVNLPTTGSTSNRVLDGNKGTVIAVSPNYATDSTIWLAADSDGSVTDELYRSTNGGNTWKFVDADGAAAAAIVAIVPSPYYATDSTVFVATTLSVFRSTDGGATFSQLGASQGAGNLVIRAMAVSPNYNGIGEVAIGLVDLAAGVAGLPSGSTADNAVLVWGRGSVLNWVAPATNDLPADVTSIAYSPSFSGDGVLMAVGSAAAAASGAVVGTALYHLVGTGSTWNGVLGSILLDVLILDVGGADNSDADGGPIVSTAIAVPSDYDASDSSTRMLFVGTASTDTTGAASVEDDDGIFRITTTATRQIGPNPGALGETQISTLAYSGIRTDGTLLATDTGAALANSVYRSTTADTATTSAAAVYSTRRPVPGLAATTAAAGAGVAVSGSTAFAIINSSATTNGGFSRSTDTGTSWSQISHFRNTLITSGVTATVGGAVAAGTFGPAGFALAPNFSTSAHIIMGVSDDVATVDGVFRSTSGGSVWERTDSPTLAANLSFVFSYDPAFATSDTIYYGTIGGNTLKRSTNGGLTWSTRSTVACGGSTISSLLAVDASTVVIGCAGGVVNRSINGGFVFTAATGTPGGAVSDIELSPNYATDSTILIGATGRVSMSVNGGVSFVSQGAKPQTTTLTPVVAFHPDYATNNLIYVGSATAAEGVERLNASTDTTSTAWTNIGMTTAGQIVTGLGFANGGTLYATDSIAAGVTVGTLGGLFSSATPTASSASGVGLAQVGVTTGGTNLVASENTRNLEIADNGELWLVIDDAAASASADDLRHYTDSINTTAVPTNLLPANGTTGVGSSNAAATGVTGFSISFDAVTGATKYQYQWSTSSTFASAGNAATSAAASTKSFAEAVIALAPGDVAGTRVAGQTYYWRARVAAPVIGSWSPSSSLTMLLLAGTTAGVPTLVQPNATNAVAALSSSTSLRPLFVWSAVGGAVNYELQVSTDGTFIDVSQIVINLADTSALGNSLAYQAATDLQPGTVYFWRVRGTNATTTGAYPPAAAFTTSSDAVGGSVTAATALAPLEAVAGRLELVSSFNYTTSLYEAYVPGLAGNILATIQPNTVLFVTVTVDTTIVVSGVSFAVKANTPTPVPVGGSVTITVQA